MITATATAASRVGAGVAATTDYLPLPFILTNGSPLSTLRSGVNDRRRRGSGRMRQDLKVVLVFLLFVEVIHSVGYMSGWW